MKIGDGAVVGANSFVNKNVEPYSIVFGSPAQLYKYRFSREVQEQLQESKYWDLDPQRTRFLLLKIKI